MYGKKYLKKTLSMDTCTIKSFKKKLKQVRKEVLSELPIFNYKATVEDWDYVKYEEEFNKLVNDVIDHLIEVPRECNAFELLPGNDGFKLYIGSKRP